MPTNLTDIINSTADAAKKELEMIITNETPEILAAKDLYLYNFKERTTALLDIAADPDFAGDKLAFAIKRWQDEKMILQSEVLSMLVIGSGIAQMIINSILNILITAVQMVLPTIV